MVVRARRRRRINTHQMQRAAHLVTATAVAAYVYLTPDPGALLATAVRWVVLPFLALSGLAMGLWPRIRRRLRTAGAIRRSPAAG